MSHAQSSFDARARSTHVLTPQRSGPRSRARSAFRLLMHARHASVLTHLCVHETFTPFDAHASCSPRSPRHARLSTLTPCSSRRLPVFANALRRSRFRSLQPETAFRQLQTAARRFGVHETCSSFDAHVRVRRWVPTSVNRLPTFTSCSPSRCLRTCSVFRRFTFASTFGSLRRSFTLRGRAHARLTTVMTASTSCERSSALRLRVHGSCSLRSIGRAHHRDAFRARLSALTAWSLPEVNLGALVFRRSPSSFTLAAYRFALVFRRSHRAPPSAHSPRAREIVLTFRRDELRCLSTSRSDDDGDRLSTFARRMTKTRRLSADSFGGRSRPPFDDPRPTFTAPILFRRSSPLITVSHLPLKSRCRITACDPLSRTAAAPLRDISDHLAMILHVAHRDPRRLLHHLSTMRRRAASTSRSVLVFRRSRSCSPDRAFM